MKSLSEFAKQPELIQIVLDSEDIVAEFGEAITFYMKDYVDINTYFEFFRGQAEHGDGLNNLLRRIILNERSEPVLKEGDTLPVNLAVAVLSKVNENLGKLKTKPLTKETGTQPS